MIRRTRGAVIALSVAIGSFLAGATPASAQLLNEVQVFGSEWVELYNNTAEFIDIGTLSIKGTGAATYDPPNDGTLLPPGGYIKIDIGVINFLSDLGGETSVIDRTTMTPFDKVTYGRNGSAPLPTLSTTLARAPDASVGAPPFDLFTDGLSWTVGFSPTEGTPNTAPTATLGVSLRLNEFNAFPGGTGDDQIEIFNPTGSDVDLAGWTLVAGGADPIALSGIVGAGDAFAVNLPGGVELEATEVLYLFDDGEVRLDQSGFAGAPVLDPDECVGLADDGVAPILGFDFSTSGLVTLECSIGEPNNNPTPTERSTWGTLKSVFR